MANVMFDFGIGLIPIVGDFINVLYKCNSRNFVLLEKHLVKKYGNKETIPVAAKSKNGNKGIPAPATTTTTTTTTSPAGTTQPSTNRPVPPPPPQNVSTPGTYTNDRIHEVNNQV